MNPQARHEKILTETVGDELVVYDEESHQAHRLNRTAALVWQNCDGQHSVADLTGLLRQEIGAAASAEMVWLALDRLEAARLLQAPWQRSTEEQGLSRRQAVQKVSLAGVLAALLPVVFTLAVPSPAQAQSE